MQNCQYYKNSALNVLRGNWAPSVLATVVFVAVAMVISCSSSIYDVTHPTPLPLGLSGAFTLIAILVTMPMQVGYYNAMRLHMLGASDDVTRNMFSTGFGNYLHNVWGMLLMSIKCFLWSLLLFVPGVIKGIAYAMTPFILVEEPELSASQAIAKSNAMMKGHKWEYFVLCLSFIGWVFLGILTLGIGYFWLEPYTIGALAHFYEDVKREYEESAA